MASRTGSARSRSAVSPPTMRVSLPLSARLTLPETGASRTPAPRGPDRRLVATERSRRHGRAVDEDRSRSGTRAEPVGSAVDRVDGVAVGEHRDRQVDRRRQPRPVASRRSPPSSSASGGPQSGERFQTTSSNRRVAQGTSHRLAHPPCSEDPTAVTSSAPSSDPWSSFPALSTRWRRTARRQGSG